MMQNIGGFFSGAASRAVSLYDYCTVEVWKDQRKLWWVDLAKIINLSVRSFLDKNLQEKACALTYRTVLATIPVLAILFAICRGFGFQNLLETELVKYFPAQREILARMLGFVDSYLAHASSGLFLGIGLILMLYTLINLLSSVEDSFNNIWGISKPRSLVRRVVDYTAFFFIMPIFIIALGGLQLMVTSKMQKFLDIDSSYIGVVFNCAPWVLTCLTYAVVFVLIPNTKVHVKNALVSGVICGIAYEIVQYLIVSGQIYVSNYNAIYGSFAFLPLFLIFIQLSWLICLSGVVATYSSQNVYHFSFTDDIDNIAPSYRREITIIILAAIVDRFDRDLPPYTQIEITKDLGIPVRIVQRSVADLCHVGLIRMSEEDGHDAVYIPNHNIERMTINNVSELLRNNGNRDFVPLIGENFGKELSIIRTLRADHLKHGDMLIKDLMRQKQENS